jgi:chemotaxis protein CheD
MRLLIVGISDCQVSRDPECELVTYALGSCIAVAIYDPVAHVAGLLHLMLPDSAIDAAQAAAKPYMFADTGVPLLFRRAYELGAEKRRIVVRLAGGAQVIDDNGVFDIGRRNYLAIRRILWKAGVLTQGEAVGGTTSRTVRLEVASGSMWLRGDAGIEEKFGASSGRSKGMGYGVPGFDRG